jgi:hypothetical protein
MMIMIGMFDTTSMHYGGQLVVDLQIHSSWAMIRVHI